MAKRRARSQAQAYIHNEFDTPWKDVLGSLFPEFMHFFFANAAREINWEAGYTVLDKELRKISRDATSGNRFADSLVRVERLSGEEIFVMLHVEIQGTPEGNFAERMFTYNYRIYDRYRLPVASFALLTDESATWRPQELVHKTLGTETQFRFGMAKLLDFHALVETITEQPRGTAINPFALMTLAHLKAQATRGIAPTLQAERFQAKVQMIRMLYAHHFTKEHIVAIFRFLDWVLTLPEGLENELTTIIHTELENDMPYLSRMERLAIEKGIGQGIEQGIERGIEQGREQERKESTRRLLETARNLLPILADQQISEVTGLPVEAIEGLRGERK